MAWKNREETCSAPWLVHRVSRADLVYVSMCEVVRWVCVWACVSLQCAFTVLPSSLPCCPFIQTERNQTTPTASTDPPAILSLLFFSFPLVLNLSPIYEAFLCGCVTWFEANRKRANETQGEREGFVLLGFMSYCALIFLSLLHSCG